jgi:hypothetical protein
VTTHCTTAAEKPNSRSMEGSATLTMLKSVKSFRSRSAPIGAPGSEAAGQEVLSGSGRVHLTRNGRLIYGELPTLSAFLRKTDR